MIDGLRATPLKDKWIKDNTFTLEKNRPIQIDYKHNNVTLLIKEEDLNEELRIHSHFNDTESAIVGNEFCLNFLKDPKKVDMTYVFITQEKNVNIYLYDMKKTFAGINTILKLIDQWKSSINTMQYCINQLDGYTISSINIGVITEDDDFERRKREIEEILSKANVSIPQNVSSFIKSKYSANNVENMKKAKILKGFPEGQVTINNHTYHYDVRLFIDQKYDMFFNENFKPT